MEHIGGIPKCSFRIDQLKFCSSGKCWDNYPCTISYFSVHCYSFTETKCHWFDSSLSFWALVVQPVTEISWNDDYDADFESCVPVDRIQVPDIQTGFIDLYDDMVPG